jgi:hypothetical protein
VHEAMIKKGLIKYLIKLKLSRKCLLADMSVEASIKSSVTDIFDMSAGCQ